MNEEKKGSKEVTGNEMSRRKALAGAAKIGAGVAGLGALASILGPSRAAAQGGDPPVEELQIQTWTLNQLQSFLLQCTELDPYNRLVSVVVDPNDGNLMFIGMLENAAAY